jgi:hypothetical protein
MGGRSISVQPAADAGAEGVYAGVEVGDDEDLLPGVGVDTAVGDKLRRQERESVKVLLRRCQVFRLRLGTALMAKRPFSYVSMQLLLEPGVDNFDRSICKRMAKSAFRTWINL